MAQQFAMRLFIGLQPRQVLGNEFQLPSGRKIRVHLGAIKETYLPTPIVLGLDAASRGTRMEAKNGEECYTIEFLGFSFSIDVEVLLARVL